MKHAARPAVGTETVDGPIIGSYETTLHPVINHQFLSDAQWPEDIEIGVDMLAIPKNLNHDRWILYPATAKTVRGDGSVVVQFLDGTVITYAPDTIANTYRKQF